MEGHMTGDHVRMCLEPCAEIRGLERGWLSEGEERDPDCAQVRRPPGKFHRRALLGQGYFVSTVGLDERGVERFAHQVDGCRTQGQMQCRIKSERPSLDAVVFL